MSKSAQVRGNIKSALKDEFKADLREELFMERVYLAIIARRISAHPSASCAISLKHSTKCIS